jgi:hypothetical protein
MREDKKKHDDEMLIVHKPGAKADPDKGGRSPSGAPRVPALERQELDLLQKQVKAAKDPAVRRDLVARVQQRFGNEKAIEVVREIREKNPDDDIHYKPPAVDSKKDSKGKA